MAAERYVVKLGGEIMLHAALDTLAADTVELAEAGVRLVLVHGGGPQADSLAERLGHTVRKVAGRRVTDDDALEVAKMVYGGSINIELLGVLKRHGGRGVGLSGVDADLITVVRRAPVRVRDPGSDEDLLVDFGHVGDVAEVDVSVIEGLWSKGYVPIVASLAADRYGNLYNVNADTIATTLAVHLQADGLLLMTNVPGLLRDPADPGSLISHVTVAEIEELAANGAIRGGMLPKVQNALDALRAGVMRVQILVALARTRYETASSMSLTAQPSLPSLFGYNSAMTSLIGETTEVEQSADAIREAFAEYEASFQQITRKAKGRFERGEWRQVHTDAEERLDLYKNIVDKTVARLKQDLGAQGADGDYWTAVKDRYTQLIVERYDFDLAESFYNSVTMRMVASRGIEPAIEYMGTEFPVPPLAADHDQVYRTYQAKAGAEALISQLLEEYRFEADYRDIQQTAERVAAEIEANLPGQTVELIEMAKPVFYRGKAAYLVGRLLTGAGYTPLVLALMNDEDGVDVDAVLMTEDEVSIIFSFARSYFHVEVEKPYALVHFLKQIMPLKPIAELYISLGYNKHGKTELYRDLRRHLAVSNDRFEIAPGERGMVMVVFTLPSYDVVFKVIKDSFDYPKVTTRREVQNHYQLVFKHDRGGRLVDAQEFEHLRFDKDRFSPALLDELLRVAANSVVVEGDTVEIKHLYTERRLTPLNIYLHKVGPEEAKEAVNDYGQAIKDLAATNIFPGDILLKNFGVTRHGRVVFYDYDELCLLTDCNFREMPTTHDPDEAVSSEPWFFVDENDVFPEELATFLGLPPPLREVFTRSNSELFGVDFWTQLQARHRAGEVIDIFPYKESRRLDKEVPV